MAEFKYYRDDKLGVSPSALGDLFGVGFNTPIDRFRLDVGEVSQEFTQEELDRINLGKVLENSVLDYFEDRFKIKITDRNDEMKEALGGTVRYIIDGFTVFEGVPTGVECKVSNSSSGSFYDNAGYLLQVQAYMEFEDVEQWFLLGLQNGKPVSRLIKRDREIGKLIREMSQFYSEALLGIKNFISDFPKHLVKLYNNSVEVKQVDEITEDTHKLILELREVKEAIKTNTKREKEIVELLKTAYDDEEIVTSDYKLTVTTSSRKGSVNLDRLLLDYPQIDLDNYIDEPTTFKTVRLAKGVK